MSEGTNGSIDIKTYSIIILGNSGVGKSSILKRLVYNKFDGNSIPTIGFEISNKIIRLKNNETIKLRLIDTAGQEQYRALGRTYFKNSDFVLFVFALNDKKSFDEIRNWVSNYKEINTDFDSNKTLPALLLGNKCDLDRVINEEEIQKCQNDIKIYGYKETSAKDNIGFELIFEEIGEILNKLYGKRKNKHNVKLAMKHKKNSKECNCMSGDE